MPTHLFRFVALVIVINSSVGSMAYANEGEQVKLDQACEAVCLSEAKIYNGNRINGAPLFYELPACEKAFVFRKKHTK